MFDLESFKIDLKGLKEGKTLYQFQLNDEYFEAIEAPEVQRGEIHVALSVQRTNDFFELNFHIEGVIRIPCNLCLDDMDQTINADNRLVAKFGDEYSEEDDLVTIDENEGVLDVAWFIYEFIELNIPIRHVHAPGKCNPAMIRMLEEHTVARSDEEEETIDSRWAALKKLKD